MDQNSEKFTVNVQPWMIFREVVPVPIKEEPAPAATDEYMTAEEAASYIKVHVETLRKWVRLGVFPHVPLPGAGKDYRFSKFIIDEWARSGILGKR
jgi:excisionase family DNA binding protein